MKKQISISMKSNVILGLMISSLAATTLAANEPAIIPQPQKTVVKQGVFELTPNIRISTEDEDGKIKSEMEPLLARLRTATGYRLSWEAPLIGGLVDWGCRAECQARVGHFTGEKIEKTNFFSPPSGPVTGSFNGLHRESNFLALQALRAGDRPEAAPQHRRSGDSIRYLQTGKIVHSLVTKKT